MDETDETITVSGTSGSLTVNSATINLTDDDGAPTSITLSVNDNSVAEDDGVTTITVKATVNGTTQFAEAKTVSVSVGGSGTATAVDFAAVSDFDITIAAGAMSEDETFTLTPTNDVVDETNETITVRGTSSGLIVNSATITLTDDDAAPTAITLTVNDNSVGEGDGATAITVTATVDGTTRFAAATTVTVSVAGSGTATAVDFAAVSDFDITIAAEAASEDETFTLTPTNDVVDETNETVTVSGASGSLTVNSATITLTDDDAAPTSITLTVNDDSVSEDDRATTITVTATVDGTTRFAAATTVTVSVAGTAPSTAVDFAAVDAFDIEIDAGAASGASDFTLMPTDNVLYNTDETITVSGTSGSLTVNAATITLADDEGPATLSINSPRVTEGSSGSKDLTFTVTLSPVSTQQVTVDYADAGTGTATSGTDYVAISGGTLTFPAGTARQEITVTVRGDTTVEPDETVVVSLSNPANAPIGTGTGTIANDDVSDPPPVDDAPSLSIDSPSVAEGDNEMVSLTFTVTLSPASSAQVTVDYVVTGTAASGTDYAAITGGTLTFPPGTTSRTITVSVMGDVLNEGDETVVVTLSNVRNAAIDTATGTGTITDDDAGPKLSIDSPSVAEGNSGSTTLTFTVTLSEALTEQVTVDYADAGSGTATPGTDYTAITGGTLTFPAGATSRTFDVSVTGDTLDEADETVAVTLSNAVNAAIGAATGTATITDDDAPPSLSIDSPRVAEGNSGATTLTFTVTLSAASGLAVTVDYADAGTGTATSGTDYAALAGGTLTFPAGTTSQTFDVSVTGDAAAEPDETVVVTLSNAGNATIGTATGAGAITDDDSGPSLSIDSPRVLEGDSGSTTLTFTVTLSETHTEAVTVDYADAGSGTATPGTDYTALTGGALTFPAGATSQTFDVSVTGDVLDEADETIVVTLSNAVNAAIATLTGTGAITDDDEPPSLSIDSPSVPEGNAGSVSLTWTVTLSAASGRVVTVDYADAGTGTATSGTDYAALAAGALTFPAGATSRTFDVSVTGDADKEADETVVVTLGNAMNATIGTATGTGTITDDDDLKPSFGSATIPAQSWTQNWPIPALTLPAATGGDGALSYALTPALPSGLSFDGATREVSGTPMKALGATEYSLTATDEDGDKATLSFEIEVAGPIALSIADAQAVEGEPVEFGITLSRPVPAAGAMLVVWRVTDGTALAHSDYALPGGRQGELTVGAGQAAATLVIQTTNDELAEGEETFTAMLVGSSHAQLGDAKATGRIVDDDLASLRGEALQWSLAAFGRTVATEAVDAIGQRFRPGGSSSATRAGGSDAPARDGTGAGSGTAGAGSGTTGAGWTAGATGAGSGTMGAGWTTGAWRNFSLDSPAGSSSPGGFSGPERSPRGEFLSTVAFETNLGATDADGGSGRQWTLWGRGSRSQFSGRSGARLTLDGEVNTGYLGADVRLAEGGPLLGVALSYSDGQVDYEAAEAGLNKGRVDLDLSSVLPYGHWALNERVSFWGLLGIGWGKASLTDEFGRVTTDTEMQMAALGSRGELATWRGLALALKGDAFVVNMEGSEWARGDAVMLPEVDADANRLRLMVEGRREWQPSPQQQLGLSLEFGGRWDGGDADTGMGTELGGGLEYRHAAWGLGIETRGRYLLGHTERAFEEWGASVALALDPGEEGVGPSLTLAPAWGEASSGVENMWREERLLGASLGDQETLTERGGWRPNRLRMELGYGFETRARRLLKLYSALEEAGPGSRNWRLGSQVTGRWLNWSLELDRRENWGGPPEHGIFLRFGNGLTNTNPVASPLSN